MLGTGTDFFIRIEFAAQALDLCPSGDAGLDPVSGEIAFDDIDIFAFAGLSVNGVRTRADQGKFALQHVE
ncbi:hypothetical protein D3C87_1800680 [compost metagenome]